MALKQQITLKTIQRLALTPKMRQALHILQLPVMELRGFLEEKMTENPLLEEAEQPEDEQIKESLPSEEIMDRLRKQEESADDDFYERFSYDAELQKKQSFKESLPEYLPSLQDYLLRQLNLSELKGTQYKLGQLIIGNIDENGYLSCGIAEIQQSAGANAEDVQQALEIVQSFEPSGVGATNLQECLLIQLSHKDKEGSLAAKIVQNYLPQLQKRQFDYLADVFRVDNDAVEKAVKEITSLEPKPGRAFFISGNCYVKADITLQKQKNQYEVVINDRELPALQLSPKYRKLLQNDNLPAETRAYLKKQLDYAVWLIKAVAQRQSTLLKVTRFLVEKQQEFIEKGEQYLRPLTLDKIAKAVDRDKSTVSRVIANKYIETPFGLFPLRGFLSQGIESPKGPALSVKNIQSQIQELIKNENPRRPLTDEKIKKLLEERQIILARRTCAKYREELNILPAHLRKRITDGSK